MAIYRAKTQQCNCAEISEPSRLQTQALMMKLQPFNLKSTPEPNSVLRQAVSHMLDITWEKA